MAGDDALVLLDLTLPRRDRLEVAGIHKWTCAAGASSPTDTRCS